jgi:hypothetical protein
MCRPFVVQAAIGRLFAFTDGEMDHFFRLILVCLFGTALLFGALTKVSKSARQLVGEWKKWQVLLAPKHNSKKPRLKSPSL